LGREISLLFAKEGAKVIAVARREERLKELVELTEDYPGTIIPLRGDMTKEEDINNMIDMAVEKFGKLDILINNAGIVDNHMTAGDIDDETWNNVIDINLTA